MFVPPISLFRSASKMCQKNFIPILCLVLASSLCVVTAQVCGQSIFIRNGTYDTNRRLMHSTLAAKVSSSLNRYYNGSIGEGLDRVYGLGLCIPGSDPKLCSDCIQPASESILQNCPYQFNSFLWRTADTLCFVRYSNRSTSDNYYDLRFVGPVCSNVIITWNVTEFNSIWEKFMAAMIVVASNPSTPNYYAAQVDSSKGNQNIYALMQCIPGLSSSDCSSCLDDSVRIYKSLCGERQKYSSHRPMCFFQWDIYPYYNIDFRIVETKKVPKKRSYTGTFIAMAIIAALIVALVVSVFVYRRRRKSVNMPIPQHKQVNHRYRAPSNVKPIRPIKIPGPEYKVPLNVKPTRPINMPGPEYKAPCNVEPIRPIKTTKLKIDDDGITSSLQFDFETLETATNKFSNTNKIGQGGFGEVYYGTFLDGTEIAVKRLARTSRQGLKEFKNEVVVVAKLQHRNLVSLLGFCLEGEEQILVYEFVPNMSLDYFLTDPVKQIQLDWTKRYNIIKGIARGVLYLHQDSRITIIHRDLKASNILLGSDMSPKIADFGIARMFGMEQTRADTSKIAGTYGYMAPEYAMHGQFSVKSDVYSFGVLVLEIISGKMNSSFYQTDGYAGSLVTHAWRLWRDGSPLELLDPTFGGNYQSGEVTQCIHTALLCVQEDPVDRPTFSTIVMMLSQLNHFANVS